MPFVDDSGHRAPAGPRQRRPRPGSHPNQPAPAPVAAGTVDPYDASADPTLQRILALGQQRGADAEAEALRLRKQLAIDYGDPELARSLGLDESTSAAAASNPFSTVAKLAKNEKERPLALDEGLNKQNLFYSGHRGLEQSNLARSLLEDRANASSSVRDRLSGITSGLLGAERGIQGDEISAQEDAAQRLRDRLGDLPLGGSAATGGAAATGGVAGALTRTAMPRPTTPRRRPAAAHRLPHGY